ncbi:MAG TPA: hypothetical protein VLZ83_17010 [Edaphocola sp.]|nr:hypothetical protein [Edaphocola sp.]
MTEFWEETFKNKHEMWGLSPAKSTALTKSKICTHSRDLLWTERADFPRKWKDC